MMFVYDDIVSVKKMSMDMNFCSWRYGTKYVHSLIVI